MDFKNDDKVQSYINEVCDQIKNKRVHNEIKAELNAHLEEKTNEYLKRGKSEDEALKEAINEMGSSKQVGNELNELHKCNPDWSIIVVSVTLVLLCISFMSLFQINGEFNRFNNQCLIRDRSILCGVTGGIVLLIACFIDYRKIKIYSYYIYIIGIVLLIFTVVRSLNSTGYRQWLKIGDFSVNMGYFSLILFIVALAGIYDKYEWDDRNKIIKGFVLGIVPLIVVSLTTSLTCFVLYGGPLILLIHMSKANKKILGVFFITEILILNLTGLGVEQVSGFINKWNDINDSGYIYNQLKIIRDSSVLFGRGANFDLIRVPEFYNDVIFSSIVYSFGWTVGIMLVIFIAILLFRIIKVAISVKNSYGKSLVLGVTAILGIQFAWNILFNLGMIFGSVPLPFISNGGTENVINMLIIGIVINVYKGRSISKA